jgi:hypothetical protein
MARIGRPEEGNRFSDAATNVLTQSGRTVWCSFGNGNSFRYCQITCHLFDASVGASINPWALNAKTLAGFQGAYFPSCAMYRHTPLSDLGQRYANAL